MKLTVSNNFHNTAAAVEATETYKVGGGQSVAKVAVKALRKAARELCGMRDCTCTGPHAAVDADDNIYAIVPV